MTKLQKLIILIFVALLLIFIFVVLKPNKSLESQTSQANNNSSSQALTKKFSLEIHDGKLVSSDNTIKVEQDDNVEISINSNTADELHLHGYDKEVELKPNTPVNISFRANLTGRFEIELHHQDKVIAALEVQPK